jgi:LacI family transcriptional regulator
VPVSIRDVALRAGVSLGTVSNVLNRPDQVAEGTRERVLQAIGDLGFVRNESARQLRAGTSRTLGLESMRRRGTPVVLVDRRASGPGQCSVAVDDVLGGRLAADHLIERGHRRLAFVGGSSGLPQIQERHAGVVAAVRERWGDEEALTVFAPSVLTVETGRQAAAQIVGMPAAQRPTAVICANDLLALGVLQEMTRHGVRVPEECAIVGYDDIDFAAAAAVPLTSVRKPRRELGRRAAELLLDESAEGHVHEQIVFEPVLVVRESSMTRRTSSRADRTA